MKKLKCLWERLNQTTPVRKFDHYTGAHPWQHRAFWVCTLGMIAFMAKAHADLNTENCCSLVKLSGLITALMVYLGLVTWWVVKITQQELQPPIIPEGHSPKIINPPVGQFRLRRGSWWIKATSIILAILIVPATTRAQEAEPRLGGWWLFFACVGVGTVAVGTALFVKKCAKVLDKPKPTTNAEPEEINFTLSVPPPPAELDFVELNFVPPPPPELPPDNQCSCEGPLLGPGEKLTLPRGSFAGTLFLNKDDELQLQFQPVEFLEPTTQDLEPEPLEITHPVTVVVYYTTDLTNPKKWTESHRTDVYLGQQIWVIADTSRFEKAFLEAVILEE